MKLASWNVNSIRVRRERLLRWLEAHRPDVLCLQELKVTESQFPMDALRAAGYDVAVFGQKGYNGVAVLSRVGLGLADVRLGLDDGVEDVTARLVSARVGSLRVITVYVPNGQVVGSEKYAYKLEWLRRLRAYLERHHRTSEPLVLCGDFNVAPEPRDVQFPKQWEQSVLFHPDVRAALRQVTDWGLTDTFRLHHREGGFYSWWDYRMLSFPKNDGLRLDLVLATEPVARSCTEASIERNERKGKLASDHVPVLATLGDV
ncbi:MAG: exodeoxyribonuclease III [Acidobacteria bacterium]|nr:MAG: exodeoxyribonuclease III [Acidobacteriota bacterium]